MSGLRVQSLCSRDVGDGWCLILLLSVGGTWELPCPLYLSCLGQPGKPPGKVFPEEGNMKWQKREDFLAAGKFF